MSIQDAVVRLALAYAVHERIAALAAAGGPAREDWQRITAYETAYAEGDDGWYSHVLAAGALAYLAAALAPSAVTGRADVTEARAVFDMTADALAVLAHCPGGVALCGQHFDVLTTEAA